MYNGNSWTDYDVSDGLIGPVVRCLAIDSQDFVWVATSTGISKISNIPGNINDLKKNSFTIYPNPTNGITTLELDKTYDLVNINIMDITGKTISSNSYNSTKKITFEIIETSGIYIVEVSTTNEHFKIKLLKQ